MSGLLLLVDTETTGLPPRGASVTDPNYPRIVQLAAVLLEGELEVAGVELVLRPDGWEVPEEAARVHGISTERALQLGVPVALAVAAYTNLRALADEVAGHNLEFDLKMLASELHRLGRTPAHPGPSRLSCTADLGAPAVDLPPTARMVEYGFNRPKRPTLEELHRFLFDLPVAGAHGALSDARAAGRCLLELRRRGFA